ncbi:hypothetical protein D3C77_263550 [compost metagenome]
MQVGSAAHGQALAGRQYRVVIDARRVQGTPGFIIQWNAAFAGGGSLASAALCFDQCTNGMPAVADNLRRMANGSGHHLKANDHDAQVQPIVEAFQQYPAIEAPGVLYRLVDFFQAGQVYRHALALFAVQRLDHYCTVVLEKGQVVIGIAGQLLCRQLQAGVLQHLVGQALVLAQGHAHGAGKVTQRFAAAYPPAAEAEGEQAGVGIIHLHVDTTPIGFFDNDPGIGIEPGLGARAEEQRLVDGVFALDRESRQGAKSQLGVKALGLAVVVQHREVEAAQAAAHEVFDQMTHQHLADPGPGALRIDRQAPETAAMFRVGEGLVMIEAHDAADDRATVFVLCQPEHRATEVTRRQQRRVDGEHATGQVQSVDRLPVAVALRAADAKAAKHALRRAVVGEPQAQGVGGVEEQLLRSLGQHLLRGRDIQGDIALAGVFILQGIGQACRIRVSVADQQTPPAAMQCARLVVGLAAIASQLRLQTRVGWHLAAQQTLAIR